MRYPPCPRPPAPPAPPVNPAHESGRDLLACATALALSSAALLLCGQPGAAFLVLALATVLAALGAYLLARPEPVGGWRCTRHIDRGRAAPWGRCTLLRGHNGTCVP